MGGYALKYVLIYISFKYLISDVFKLGRNIKLVDSEGN